MSEPVDGASRFDLEEALTALWGTKEDLELLEEEVLEGEPSADDIANALMGVARLHDLRAAKAFRIFEELVRSGKLS